MPKRVSSTFFLLVGLLVLAAVASACQPKATGLAQASPSPTATLIPATPLPSPTATAVQEPTATATIAPVVTPTQPKVDPTPTTEPQTGQEKPAPTPTIPWQIPEEREDDWAKGGENAGLIMVEYGDYQ